MKTNIDIKETGNLDIFYIIDGKRVPVMSSSNAAVSTGAAVLANALAGKGGISYLYIMYANDVSSIVYPGITKDTTLDVFTNAQSPYGCIKVPAYLLGTVNDGTITLQGITIDSEPLNSNMSPFDVGSKVFAVGLAGTVNGVDKLFCIANIKQNGNNSYISKIANAQVGINWIINLTTGN